MGQKHCQEHYSLGFYDGFLFIFKPSTETQSLWEKNLISIQCILLRKQAEIWILYQYPDFKRKHLLTDYLPDEEQVQEK